MTEMLKVLLFGDETSDFGEPLQKLCERHNGIVFPRFLDQLTDVLRDEINRQPRHLRSQIPPFTDILDLVIQYRSSDSQIQHLETTLACVCQLGSVLRCVRWHSWSQKPKTDRLAFLTIIHLIILCLETQYLLVFAQAYWRL